MIYIILAVAVLVLFYSVFLYKRTGKKKPVHAKKPHERVAKQTATSKKAEKREQPKHREPKKVLREERVIAEEKPVSKTETEKQEPIIEPTQRPESKLFFRVAEHGFSDDKQKEEIRDLIVQGADKNVFNHQDFTPIHLAVLNNKPEVVEFFLKQQANPNTHNIFDYTPLDTAAEFGHVEILHVLLDAGARPNIGSGITTPLHRAAANGHEDAVVMLLEAGADPYARDEKGQTPQELARKNGHQYVVDLFVE